MVVVGIEAWSCLNPVSVLLSLGRVSTQWLCVNPGLVSTLDRVLMCLHSIHSLFNELIFGLGFLELTHIVNMWLKLMNFTCRVLSAR
jgi:hypothetical protein